MRERALGVIRLSELDDESTSPARQREIITKAADIRDAEIVGWAEDLDVSATQKRPTERPELARWLDRTEDYDLILFWRTDRFVRKVRDLADMIDWAKKHGKALASATEPFDLSSPFGEAMAYMIAIFAQMESANTSIRVLGAHEYLRRNRRWGGGRPPYGYKIIDNLDGPGKALAIEEGTAEVVREAVRRIIGGESVGSVVADFNRRGLPSPHGKARWDNGSSLRRILRDPALLGQVVYNGHPVLGDDGMPITRADPLIDAAEWASLQAALDALGVKRRRTATSSMLLNVAACAQCGRPLYRWTKFNTRLNAKGERVKYGPFSYYRCKGGYTLSSEPKACGAKLISCMELDAWVDAWFTADGPFADVEIIERVTVPGDNHASEIAAVNEAINNLTVQFTREAISDDEYDAKLASLRTERARLRALPGEPDQTIERATGVTVGQHWQRLDAPGKRRYLLSANITVHAQRGDDGRLDCWMTGDPHVVIGALRRSECA